MTKRLQAQRTAGRLIGTPLLYRPASWTAYKLRISWCQQGKGDAVRELLNGDNGMSKGAINFSSDNEYYTPKSIVSIFGSFDYDPATTKEKANDLNIPHYDTIESDGLTKDWSIYGRIWCNPPFTHKHLFLEKAVKTFMEVRNEIFFLAPIEFLSTKRFYEQIKIMGGGIKLFLFNGRIKFESGLGKDSKSPAFGSVVFKL